jgi:hypothetical protein
MRAVRPHLILFSSDEQTNQQANTRGDGNCREGIIFYIITYNIRRLLGSLTTLCSDFTGSTFYLMSAIIGQFTIFLRLLLWLYLQLSQT